MSDRTEKMQRRSLRQPLEGCVLYVAAGADRGKSITLQRGEITLGSGETCDLVLTDSTVSRNHARFVAHPDGIEVVDLGSTNGTYYLEQRLERAVVEPGVRLELGRCTVDILPLAEAQKKGTLSKRESYGDLVGSSPPMRVLYGLLEKLEGSEAPVLIQGETGTGKELVAQAIHAHSRRSDGPFITIDCGNVAREIMESELFGHEKGSFTGADRSRAGAFVAANHGTVFLDEIGELPIDLQSKLLRVLESGEVKPVGADQWRATDVRVIAATHRDLSQQVSGGDLRQDLYYRLAVIRLGVPELRDRRQDIPILARHLARQIQEPNELPAAAIDFFMRYDWPGNVRELRNAVHRVLALGVDGLQAEPDTIPRPTAESTVVSANAEVEYRKARRELLDQFEAAYMRDLMERFPDNLSEAARSAGIDRRRLRDLLKKHGLYGKAD